MRKILLLLFIAISCNLSAQENRHEEPVEQVPPPLGVGCMPHAVIDPDGDGFVMINITSLANYIRLYGAQSWGHNLSGYSILFYHTAAERESNNPITTNSSVANNDSFYMKLTYIGEGPQQSFVPSQFNCIGFTIYSSTADTDLDGIPNLLEDLSNNGSLSDDDTDGIWPANFADNDDDNDGILTINEDYNSNGSVLDDDMDSNGIPDYLDNSARGSLQLNLKLFIEGYYSGSGTMQSVKFNQDGISPTTDVENIIVELHSTTSPYVLVASTTAMLRTNGNLNCSFPTASVGSYYIAVKSRSGIETWSNTPQSLDNVAVTYNFSTSANKAFGNNMKDLGSGVYGLYSGDIPNGEVKDGFIDGSDYSIWEMDYNEFAFGIYTTDLNGDGFVDGSDYSIWEGNYNSFIVALKPE